MSAYGARAAVIAALDRMVQEGTILGFQTLHFGKADTEEDRMVIVTAPGHLDAAAMQALAQEIRSALQVLVGEVVVIVTRSPSGR
jgi:Mrp family chromosome partitioning ATPase